MDTIMSRRGEGLNIPKFPLDKLKASLGIIKRNGDLRSTEEKHITRELGSISMNQAI